ncbi:MAG: ankyrin repeat protein [Kiritimatiellia bacterium]|jgi:ankyrin repeat protein
MCVRGPGPTQSNFMESELIIAAASGDLETIREHGPNADPSELNRALGRAAAMNHFLAADALIEFGADPAGRYSPKYGPVLFVACEFNNPDGITYLLKAGADATATFKGQTALDHLFHSPVRSELKYKCISLLMKAGAPLEDNAITAIQRGNLKLLRDHMDADPDLKRATYPKLSYGDFPLNGGGLLHLAVDCLETEIIRELIHRGCDVDMPAALNDEGYPVWPTNLKSLGGQTPLYHAFGQHYPMLELLLERGADVEITAPFLRDDEEIELSPLDFFLALDAVEGNMEKEITLVLERLN